MVRETKIYSHDYYIEPVKFKKPMKELLKLNSSGKFLTEEEKSRVEAYERQQRLKNKNKPKR